MEKTILIMGSFVVGFNMIYTGVMVRLGKKRSLFSWGGFPVLASPGVFLIAIPSGLGVIIIGLTMAFPQLSDLLSYPLIFFLLLSIILSFWLPDWMLPMWMSWLMSNYEHVWGEMLEEARQMGIKKWEKETRTQAELEQWADSVAKKHGWQRLQ